MKHLPVLFLTAVSGFAQIDIQPTSKFHITNSESKKLLVFGLEIVNTGPAFRFPDTPVKIKGRSYIPDLFEACLCTKTNVVIEEFGTCDFKWSRLSGLSIQSKSRIPSIGGGALDITGAPDGDYTLTIRINPKPSWKNKIFRQDGHTLFVSIKDRTVNPKKMEDPPRKIRPPEWVINSYQHRPKLTPPLLPR